MFRRIVAGVGIVLMGSTLLWVPALVYGFGGTLTISKNTVHCTDLISGGTRQTVNDGGASCAINIKEIGTFCRNKQGKQDNSNSHNFTINSTPIGESQSGSGFLIQKNGEFLSDIFFDQAEIQTALGSQFPSLDAAALCPNKINWTVEWAVTKLDLVATVNKVLNGYVPKFPILNSATAFDSCNPATSGLTYINDNGTPLDPGDDIVNPNAGILNECWIFRNRNGNNIDSVFPGADLGGVALLDPNFTAGAFYNGACEQHGKQTGSLGNVTGYVQVGPNLLDLECTGLNTVLDGTY